MARRNISQGTVASALGVSQSSISRRLRGETPFDIDELATVARVLSLDVTALLAGAA